MFVNKLLIDSHLFHRSSSLLRMSGTPDWTRTWLTANRANSKLCSVNHFVIESKLSTIGQESLRALFALLSFQGGSVVNTSQALMRELGFAVTACWQSIWACAGRPLKNATRTIEIRVRASLNWLPLSIAKANWLSGLLFLRAGAQPGLELAGSGKPEKWLK